MNKYQDAFANVYSLAHTSDYYHEHDEYDLNIIEQLVEKATPKKIIKKEKFKSCMLICPSCHRMIDSYYTYEWCKNSETTLVYKNDLSDDYCCNCGQKLDWNCNE